MTKDVCTCEYVGAGLPMHTADCTIHTLKAYGCDHGCGCKDYRPRSEPTVRKQGAYGGKVWPLCVCDHIAQEHNNGFKP